MSFEPTAQEDLIATVRKMLWTVDVVTTYRPRTDVERWQVQDRLRTRLQAHGVTEARFYERPGGRLAFRVRVGWRVSDALLGALARIDNVSA